ncbi:MAG: PqqD family protein [Alistipes sp.]|nr:PqqD family protein [Alistipes sp.]
MKFKKEYKVREIAGEHVIIKQGRFGADMTRVIALNASSLLLWNELQGREFEAEDVANILTENYEVDATTAATDAAAWVAKLAECGLIEK